MINWLKIKPTTRLFLPLLLLTTITLLFQLNTVLRLVDVHFAKLPIRSDSGISIFQSPQLVWEMFSYIGIQLALHAAWIGLIYWCTTRISQRFKFSALNRQQFGLALWFVSLIFIVLANQYYFPHSQFSWIHHDLTTTVRDQLIYYSVLSGFIISGALLFAALSVTLFTHIRHVCYISIVAATVIGALHFSKHDIHIFHKHPHVVIIGLDSLRFDHLDPQHTPYVYRFMQNGVQYHRAFTPLARTYPAWVSILTGEYPKHNGARDNLTPPDSINIKNNLTHLFKAEGYSSIFATDERRFNNIDTDYGFDHIIGPKTNANDFLIGTTNDFPLSNLLINTRLGKYLFPYNYSNRAAHVTYQPDTYIDELNHSIPENPEQPLFLAIHLCLPHWPYKWAEKLELNEKKPELSWQARYLKSLPRVDKQFKDIMQVLEQKNILSNALVFVLSDHGEALGTGSERVTIKKHYVGTNHDSKSVFHGYFSGISHGHGTDVLSLSQYHVVLGYQGFGKQETPAKIIKTPLSLKHIKSILHDKLKFKRFAQNIEKDIFFESALTLKSMYNNDPSISQLVSQGITYFKLEPKRGRLVLKKEMIPVIIANRQHAMIRWPWLLALYPLKDNTQTLILSNLETGKWTDQAHSSLAMVAPTRQMLSALRSFYGDEIRY